MSAWPTTINGWKVRARYGYCDGCWARYDRWCLSGCTFIDPMDYR